MPDQLQLRRTKGWRKPEGAVIVSRPSKWGNPWRILIEPPEHGEHVRQWHRVQNIIDGRSIGAFVSLDTARRTATSQFRTDLENGRLSFSLADVVRELAGRDLCCWCTPTPLNPNGSTNWLGLQCHAEVLLEFANGTDSQ